MTVCIAALADNGATAVLVADQLTSQGYLAWATESEDIPKIHPFGDSAAIMTAGDASFTHEVVKIARSCHDLWNPKLPTFHHEALEAYVELRRQKVEQLFLRPRGFSSTREYLERSATLNPALVAVIDSQMLSWAMPGELISVEHANGKCSIAHIWGVGLVLSFDAGGFLCVGEGGPHATYAMLEQGYAKSLPLVDVEKIALEAKKRSEKTRSVGEKTTVAYMPATAKPQKLTGSRKLGGRAAG